MQQVHDGCFGSLAEVPRTALTMTIQAITAARHIYCMVPGATKAAAVRDTVKGVVGSSCPATALRGHDSAVLYLETHSAVLL